MGLCRGRGAGEASEEEEEDFEERERTRAAATHGPEAAILKAEANKRQVSNLNLTVRTCIPAFGKWLYYFVRSWDSTITEQSYPTFGSLSVFWNVSNGLCTSVCHFWTF